MEKKIGKEKVGERKKGYIKRALVVSLSLICVACTSRVVYIGPDEYIRMADTLRKCQDARSQCEQDLSDCTTHADDLLLNCK